jgi:hypothetical protein
MNATKNKKNMIAEHLKGLRTQRKCRAVVRSSPSAQEKDLPPRIRRLISAAVRVFELKRGIHATWPRARAYQS